MSVATSFISDKYAPFETSTHTYKVVEGHEILVETLVPKKLLLAGLDSETQQRKRPLVVRFHGGGLILGQRDLSAWTNQWVTDLVEKHDAVYVSPDYRFLPEASAEEILDDIDDFWIWVAEVLPDAVRQAYNLELDFDQVFVTGESAGGYLALQSGLSHSQSPQFQIRALVVAFPTTDLRSSFFTEDGNNISFGAPLVPASFVDEQIALLRGKGGRKVVTNVTFGEGNDREILFLAVLQHGRLFELLGPERDPSPGKRRVHVEDRIEDGSKLPPTLIYHGAEDSAVPVEKSEKFVKLLKDRQALVLKEGMMLDDAIRLIKVSGDHGVGGELRSDSVAWIKELETFSEKFWLNG